METMKDLLYVPFRFEDGGTRVIHYTPEMYDRRDDDYGETAITQCICE